MWRNLQDEMDAKASLLAEQGYVFTAKWCRRMRQNLNAYVRNPRELDLDLKDLLSTFENEYLGRTDLGSRELRRKYLKIVQAILEWAIKKGPILRQTFRELVPFLDKGTDVNKPINEVARVFSSLGDKFLEARVYGSLFVFMLHVDGQYYPTIRTLYALKTTGDGKQPTFKQIEKVTLDEMRQSMGADCQPLFEVYDRSGRHLRNAIAHANFRYADGKLFCWDTNPKSKKVEWQQEFTFNELSAIIVDTYSISHAYLYWYFLRELVDKIVQHIRPSRP